MRRNRKMMVLGMLAPVALAAPLAGVAQCNAAALAAPVVSLNLQLNDPAGSTVAKDSSGLGRNGAVGSHVKMNGSYAAFDRHPPDEGISYGLAHLIKVNDAADGSLDPGNGNFTVEIRYRTTVSFGNILQKGQATTTGGQVKLQQPRGVMGCLFKSPTGQAAVTSKTALNDGQWHVVRCVRTPADVSMYVDGVLRNRIVKSTGTINNTKPWTIGGKPNCSTTSGADSCDYFAGDVDYLKLTKG
jgi:hypothetical protein